MNTPEKAVSIDEYIHAQSRSMTADELRGLRKFDEALDKKRKEAGSQGHGDLAQGIAELAAVLHSSGVSGASDPLPRDLAEAGAALRYVLKGVDIIPDSVPGLGLADDEWMVTRVLKRNPSLRQPAH